MNYISTTQAAEKWGLSLGRILKLCRDKRIEGATQLGSVWMIPENAIKPIDARTKASKDYSSYDDLFRFFCYSRRKEESYFPQLSNEEKIILDAFNKVTCCDFSDLEHFLDILPVNSKNKYIRIVAGYCLSIICFLTNKKYRFIKAFEMVNNEFKVDFKYKKEMNIFLVELNAILGKTDNIEKELAYDPTYSYHKDALPHLIATLTLSFFYSYKRFNEDDLKAFELNLSFIENIEGEEIDKQIMHLYLALLYEMADNIKLKEYHLRATFDIALKHNLYWLPSMQYIFLGNSFENVLNTYPQDFILKIQKFSKGIQDRRREFMKDYSTNTIFDLLPKKKYIFVNYALQGFTNKEVSKLLGVSVKHVEKSYSLIYGTLGLKNKKDLIRFMKDFENLYK